MPTKEDFQQICRGPLKDVWKFVVNNVYSAQTVRKVQGNLQLQQASARGAGYRVKYKGEQSYSEEKAALLEKRKTLAGQLTTTLTSIGHVSKDLARIKTDITVAESSYRENLQEFQDTKCRAALLHSNTQRLQAQAEKYNEFTERTNSKVHHLSTLKQKLSEGDVMYSKQHQKLDPTDNEAYEMYALETACTRRVRENCEEVGSFLQQLLNGDFANDKNLMAQKKEASWKKTEETVADFPAEKIVSSLAQNATEAAQSLKEKTVRIDIQKDAEKLRFKYESSGQLQDLSSTSTSNDLKTVHQLLEEAHRENIARFVEAEKSKNHAWKLRQRLQEAGDIVEGHMKQRYREDKGALELARQVYAVEIQTAADHAAVRTLQAVTGQLQDNISRGLQHKQKLLAKYKKIQDFNKLADSKQQLIHVLVKQNVTARSRLDVQQTGIQNYILSSMSHHEADCLSSTQALSNTVSGEIDAFTKLPLSALMFTEMEGTYKTAVSDLSINRLHAFPHTTGGQALLKLMKAVEFPLYKAPECLIPQIAGLRKDVQEIEATLAYQQARAAETEDREHKAIIQRITALCEEVAEKDEQQLQRVLPMLQQRLAQTTRALTDCIGVKDSVQAWWEQPAQASCPWMKVDELSLQQWKDKWTVDVTRLRQAQIK